MTFTNNQEIRRILVVVDMQNDFIDGSLGTGEAVAIVPEVVRKIRAFDGDAVFATLDMHFEDYLTTHEGKKLPVLHCIDGTEGAKLQPQVLDALRDKNCRMIPKINSFGTFEIGKELAELFPGGQLEIEIIGLCTDICVVTNALLLRTQYPDAIITVDSHCCAGVTPERHEAALDVMRSCQIEVI